LEKVIEDRKILEYRDKVGEDRNKNKEAR